MHWLNPVSIPKLQKQTFSSVLFSSGVSILVFKKSFAKLCVKIEAPEPRAG